MEVLEREFRITNKLGLHARPAGKLVEVASAFAAETKIKRDGEAVDGKSILDVLTLACTQGTLITVMVAGVDAHVAMQAIGALIEGNFGEE